MREAPENKRYVVIAYGKGFKKRIVFPEPKTKNQATRLARKLRKEGYRAKTKKMKVGCWDNNLKTITIKRRK